MTDFEIASLAIAAANATAAIVAAVGIWHGIRAMVRANKERAVILDQQREADDQRHAEAMTRADKQHEEAMTRADKHHAETMTALDELIRGGRRQHEATMTALRHQAAALDELIRAGQRQTAALDELLRRPASAPAG